MYIKYDYCKTSIERLLSEHGNDSFQITIHNLVEIRIPKNFLSVLHPNLVSSPIKGILEILNLTTRCIPMDILAWTDCVRSSAGKIS